LTATPTSTTAIQLNWNAATDPHGVNGYNVYQVTSSSGFPSLIASLVHGTSYTVTRLATSQPGPAMYSFVVSSVDTQTGLESPYSAVARSQTLYPPTLWGTRLPDGTIVSGPITAGIGSATQIYLLAYGNAFPSFSVQNAPSDLTVNPHSGLVTFTPTKADLGLHTYTFVATNSVGSASLNVTFNVKYAVVITWPLPTRFVYGTPLGSSVLDARAYNPNSPTQIVPGTFAYTPVSGTVLGAGVQTLKATFTPTDTATYANTTATASLTVSQATVTPVLQESTTASKYGQSVTFKATLKAYGLGALPTGSVTFYDGPSSTATPIGTVPIDSTGAASLSVSSLGVGTHSIYASYGGNSNYTSSKSLTVTQSVSKNTDTTAVTSSANPIFYGQSVAYTAVVTPPSSPAGLPVPTGTVTFKDGYTVLGTATLNSQGAAIFTPTVNPTVGNHVITATYGGDSYYLGSSGSFTQIVNKGATFASLSSSSTGDQSVFGESVTLTATITAASGSGTPTGSVTFKDGVTTLATKTLVNGTATYTTTAFSVATHNVSVVYTGSTNYAASNTASLAQVVTQANTTTTVTSSALPSVYGQSVTITATVAAAAPGSGTPTGTVTFYNGSTAISSAQTLSLGKTSITLSNLAVGTYSIKAVYSGSSNYVGSSGSINQTVNQASTTTMLTTSLATPVYGQAVTFTATVKAVAPGVGKPTGSVDFWDGTTDLGPGTLNASGIATFTTAALSRGSHKITAVYNGDSNFSTSTSAAVNESVSLFRTSTYLTGPTYATYGTAVTFTATVKPTSPSSDTPTGTITLMDYGKQIGQIQIGTNGVATFQISTLLRGSHQLTAVYSGDDNFAMSTSNLLLISVF
ncbi:MAG: beta strand repeat-containing protein, partial [Isosphaeraceae bacterium]